MVRLKVRRGGPTRGALCSGIVLAGIIINQSAVHWRRNVVDSDLFAYYGWCVVHGARPYLDIWDNKPPGIWWANAAAIALVGPGPQADILLGTGALLATQAAFLGVVRAAYGRRLVLPAALAGAVLLTYLPFECGGNRTETFVAAAETVAIMSYLRWLRRGRVRWLVVAGLAAGAAPLFKQSGLAAALAIVVHLAITRRSWRPWPALAVSFATPGVIAALVLAAQGALGEAVFAVGGFNRAYFAVGDATWTRVDRALWNFLPLLPPLGGVLAACAVGLLCGATLRLRRRHRPRARSRSGPGLFLLWLAIGLYLACVGPGRRGHHLIPALPPLALVTVYPLYLLMGRRGLVRSMRPSAVCAAMVWMWALGMAGAASSAETAWCWHTKPHWYSLDRREPSACELHAAQIARLTTPSDTVYVWGWSPGTYRYACRLPASRFATLEKCGQVGAYADFILTGAQADVRRRLPRVFVISIGDYARLEAEKGDFSAWLDSHYRAVSTIAGVHVLVAMVT